MVSGTSILISRIGAGLYSFSAVNGAARDRHVEHGSLPHISLTSKHNGEVCVDSFAVPEFRHGSGFLLGQTIGRVESSTVSFSTRESPSFVGSGTREIGGPPAPSSDKPQSAARRAKERETPTPISLRKLGDMSNHRSLK